MRLGGGFMIPVKHDQQGEIPLMMPRHRPLGYPPSSRLSLAQPNLAEIHGDACDGKPTRGGGFTSFGLLNDEELECKSGSENLECGGGGGGGACSGEDQDGDHSRPRKKRYHRHTQHQIQELEMFFKECPHPDEKQRKALSKELGLEPLQVKFWFQNKRTQMKTQHERMENSQLKAENEKLIAENIRYKEALAHATCPSCGGPATLGEISFDENELRIENARLRDEIDRVSSVAAKYIGKPLNSLSSALPNSCGVPRSGLGMEMCGIPSAIQGISVNSNRFLAATEVEKAMVVEVAVAAMEELMKIAQMGPSLWNSCTLADENTLSEVLNEEEYLRNFRPVIGPRPYGFRSEASRDSAVVMMSPVSIVETLMDVNQWCSMFPDIVSGGSTIEILPTGVAGNFNGALQVMYAELQLPTPLVATRENYFCRYCKQHSEGFWAVVDVSLENLRGSPPPSMIKCRRRPSGLLIQEMPDGYSKVTWVEHVEVEDQPIHSICRHLVTSGMGFGAKRWLATLARQSERLASAMATAIPPSELSVIPNQEGRKSVLKLAQRMVASFCSRVGASTDQSWTNISASDAENIRVTTRKSTDDTSRPPGILLNEATSLWLPLSHDRVFDFLRDDSTRSEWDIMSNGGVVQEMAHIANGQDPANYVSLLRVNGVNPNQVNTLILQETSRDACASFVIYAPVDLTAMNAVLNGGNPDFVALLPSGFAILPDYSQKNGSGCLLSVAFQILVDSDPNAKLSLGSVAIVNTLISCTLDRIKSALISPASYQTNNNNITTSPANPPP